MTTAHPPRRRSPAKAASRSTLWQVAIDVGGTFTDCIAWRKGERPRTTKVLSSEGEQAPILGIRRLLGLGPSSPLPPLTLRLGTTRGTNALLTRTGARTALLVTRGFGDVLLIGEQDRPRLFDLAIRKPRPLFERALEVDERMGISGEVLRPIDLAQAKAHLRELAAAGIESIAICLLHGLRWPAHEQALARVAREVGFSEVSVSSDVAAVEKIVARGDTTVLDAYLNPVLRRYVGNLRAALGERCKTFHVMTSTGGLVGAESFTGKDSLLSGPAGGVVGCATAARAAGFSRALGLDMGGTSTDVCRFGGDYELRAYTQKAGVRVSTPMLAIETVAAGGGSICAFDGAKLVVGPKSAGADPGPACYGRGGPLTVTDCNLLCGRLLPERFPFPLDLDASTRRLGEIVRAIAKATSQSEPDPLRLAEGFLEVANATMGRAIRSISIEQGYDPADHVLVAFGAAAPQHVCALAKELRIRQALVPRHAGVLSAWGIGHASVTRVRERSLLGPYSEQEVSRLQPLFDELARAAREELLADAVAPDHVSAPRCFLNLRYKGTESTVAVERPQKGTFADAYADHHLRRFGYLHASRDLEIVSARVELTGRTLGPPEDGIPSASQAQGRDQAKRARARFERQMLDVAVLDRETLGPDERVEGPALVCDSHTTVVLFPGWHARLASQGELLLEDLDPQHLGTIGASPGATADPIALEIFNHRFASIADQMGDVLCQTAVSTNVKERRDFSCALFDATGNLIASAEHIPVHLGAMGETVRSVLAEHPSMAPGDVFVSNDPYEGGSHLPDITVVTPIFGESIGHEAERKQRFFLVASRAHHADVGGIVPGSMPPFSKNLAEEGVVLRNLKLVDRGQPRTRELAALLSAGPHPARRVDDNLADIEAQMAANVAGIAGLRNLLGRYSLDVVLTYAQHIQQAAALKMRIALRALPQGRRSFADHLDDGTPIAVAIDIAGESAVIDFAGTGPAQAGNLNANRAIVTAAVLYCFRCLIGENLPLNAGMLAPLEIRIPEGSLLAPQRHKDPARSAAVAGGNVETSQRLVDVILGALGVAAASQGTMNNLTFGDATFGYYETLCGGSGATELADGADAVHTHMTNTRLTDIEVLESRYPVRMLRFAIRRGSGGAGRTHGGSGVIRELEILRPLSVAILSERRGPYAPFGLAGGQPGALGRNLLRRANDPAESLLPAKVALELRAGDRLTLETPGGGGYGEPEVSAPSPPRTGLLGRSKPGP